MQFSIEVKPVLGALFGYLFQSDFWFRADIECPSLLVGAGQCTLCFDENTADILSNKDSDNYMQFYLNF